MIRKTITKLITITLLLSGFLLSSCEPPLCAYCYDRGGLIDLDGRDIEICADDTYELEELVWLAEEMGYHCKYQ